MDIKVIKELTKLMRENELVELEVEAADLKIRLKKAGNDVVHMAPVMHHHPAVQAAPAPVAALRLP